MALDLDRGYCILLHALDVFNKRVGITTDLQNGEEILMGDSNAS